MYVVELAFDDDPRRLQARVGHRERLRELRSEGILVMAGPWVDDSGAMLVFDLPSESALQAVMQRDPYYVTPGVTVRRIRGWTPLANLDTNERR